MARYIPGGLPRWAVALAVISISALLGCASACTPAATESSAVAEPWTAANTVAPADLARELAGETGVLRPIVVYTGPPFLFRAGHIPGAVAHGPASDPHGLTELRAWAQNLPRDANVVVYCGCCPLDACPNLQPSFAALRAMGFTRVRALILPDSFGRDWAAKGLPVERG
jgi:thiosulfate/3-mercaptopyruvate sulfurtransferase